MRDFTAHNVLLPDGTRTRPDTDLLLADSPWMAATRRVLAILYPYGPVGRSVVDLGCLEGGYTLEFARMGMRSLGVEIRQSNFENCRLVKAAFPIAGLEFRHDDVWNIGGLGEFDVAFCCGLLYHLDRPVEFLRLLGGVARHAVILNTHVAVPDLAEPLPGLSPITQHEGVPGRWYAEYDPVKMDAATLEQARWTSWNNHHSFWPTMPALMQVLRDCGFDLVFEQGDWLEPDIPSGMADPFYASLGRRMLVGLRTGRPGRGLVGSLRARFRHRVSRPRKA
jgi:SAM-dependent methyltransferase